MGKFYSRSKCTSFRLIELLLRVSFLLLLFYSVASVNLTTIDIGTNESVSACIPVNRDTSLYMSLVDPSCDSKVDIYQSPRYNPPRIKSYDVSFNDTSTGFIYNLTGNVDPEKLIFLYMVSCKVTYSAEIDSPSLLCITIGMQIQHCYSTNHTINGDSRQIITESGNITMFRPQDLLIQIIVRNDDRILTVNGSITIKQFYYENISYPEECSNLTIDRPQCQLKSFTNETCIFAFSNNSAKLQYGGDLQVQLYSSSTYTPSMKTCSMSPTIYDPFSNETSGTGTVIPPGAETSSKIFTLLLISFTVLVVVLIILGAIACSCFVTWRHYYTSRNNRKIHASDLEMSLYPSDEKLLSTLETRKEVDEKGSKKREKINIAAGIKQIKGKNN